jgi:sensor domain CHASE-containing protein
MGRFVNSNTNAQPWSRSILRASNLPTLIALIVITVFAVYAELQNRNNYVKGLRTEVMTEASVIRARLEGAINGNIQLVRGFVSSLATEPDMSTERFSQLGARLLDERTQIRNIAAAPDLVITMTYPLEGNEASIGLNYLEVEEQRDAALRARDTREMVLAGPVDLVQGGQGFVGRFPVYQTKVDGAREFWGLVSVVIDLETLAQSASQHLRLIRPSRI